MSFQQLVHVTKLGHAGFPHNLLVIEWNGKRQHLFVYLQDLSRLVEEYKRADRNPYEFNPLITLEDPIPGIRLASACEAATNCLYGMADIAARFGNRVSAGLLPSRFNVLRKKVEHNSLVAVGLSDWVTDFEWYRKVRELRTEWMHFSTVFVARANDCEPLLVVRCHRRPSDREEFGEQIQVRIPDLIDWIQRAISVIDNFGNYLLVRFIIPGLDPTAKFVAPKHDERGWPIITSEHRFQVEEVTVGDYLAACGIQIDR